MKNWKQIAEGSGLGIPGPDLARAAAALDALEAVFRPLARDIPEQIEPAVTFRADEEDA
jgi:hypothetical protein